MKKILLYALTAVLALGSVSCKDDEVIGNVNPADQYDRMPMTMFRNEENTGVSNDPYGTRVLEGTRNTVRLAWYGVKGCGGYQIRYGLQPNLSSGKEEDWANDDNIVGEIFIKDPEQLTVDIPYLEYSTDYRFAIRVLHPDHMDDLNSPKHSIWYGHGSGREWADYQGVTTSERYNTPGVINVGNISQNRDAFTVYVNINVKDIIDEFAATKDEAGRQAAFEDFKENFELFPEGSDSYETARFKVTSLRVNPSSDTPGATVDPEWRNKPITEADFTDGIAEFRVTGLSKNSIYQVDVFNDDKIITDSEGKKHDVDARYNTIRKAVYGEPGEPILLKHIVYAKDPVPGAVEYNASPLDTIIGNFATDVTLAEGQTFYLEGGKAYYFFANPSICKGFTLETDPADVAQGKRAIVYLGGIGNGLDATNTPTGELATCNFMFGRQKSAGEADAPIEVGRVIFRNLDFDCPKAYNFGHQSKKIHNASGNYFANMYSGGMEVVFESFEVYNCTFQRMVRGFFRVQGTKNKKFNKIVIDGNLFYNCGYYDNNGRGYAWFAGDGKGGKSNIYTDFSFTNNTIYDCPRTAMISDNDKDIEYDPEVKWNIKVNNNTFFNYSTRSTGRNIFQTRFIPGGSHYEFQNNLIVLAAADGDQRLLNQYGADLRTIKGDGTFTFTVKNNYSIGTTEAHMVDDGIFTSSSMSNKRRSFGDEAIWNPGPQNCTAEDLVVKVGSTPLKAKDVFVNALPPFTKHNPAVPDPRDHEAPANILEALKFQPTAAVTAHEIYKNRIGDPRWY